MRAVFAFFVCFQYSICVCINCTARSLDGRSSGFFFYFKPCVLSLFVCFLVLQEKLCDANCVFVFVCVQALALIELYNAPDGRYKQDVYLLPKKMGKTQFFIKVSYFLDLPLQCVLCSFSPTRGYKNKTTRILGAKKKVLGYKQQFLV